MKMTLPTTVDGGILKGIVDVIQRRGYTVRVKAEGIRGRKVPGQPVARLVIEATNPAEPSSEEAICDE